MRKSDFILASAMVFIALVWFITVKLFSKEGAVFNVYKDNVIIMTESLASDGCYYIKDDSLELMKIEVIDGAVRAVYADCPDKLCVKMGKISKDKETIVCLPNRIVIEVLNEEAGDVDAVIY